jgi:hypothetical protein
LFPTCLLSPTEVVPHEPSTYSQERSVDPALSAISAERSLHRPVLPVRRGFRQRVLLLGQAAASRYLAENTARSPRPRRHRADNLQSDTPGAPNSPPNDNGDPFLAASCIRIAIGTEITMFVPVSHADVIPRVMRSLLSDHEDTAPRCEVPPSSFQEVIVRPRGAL